MVTKIFIYDDSEGKLFQRGEYDENEELIGKTMFELDANGNRIEKHYCLDKNQILKLGSRAVYGNEDKFEDDYFDGNLIEKVSYDGNGRILPYHVYKADSTRKDRRDMVFNNDGYMIEQFCYNEHNEFSHRIVTVYDSKGNIKEHFCYEPDGTLYIKDEHVYKFDSIGNWIEKIDNHWVTGWGEVKLTPALISVASMERKGIPL